MVKPDRLKFVGVCSTAWDSPWLNRQHMMWALKDFAPVTYVQEPRGWRYKRRDEHLFRSALQCKSKNLNVLRIPKCLTSVSEGPWNDLLYQKKAGLIRRAGDDGEIRVLYLWEPDLWPYIDALQPDLVVYHVHDLPDPDERGEEVDVAREWQEMLKRADIVLVGTQEQADRIPRSTIHVPNGVCVEWHSSEAATPADIEAIPSPRIGYVGRITRKIDLTWLDAIACHSDWSVVLVGPVFKIREDPDFLELCQRDNVHVLGERSARELPAYMKSLDVGLMNYVRRTHMEVASPLKLYEYCAAGIPIVSTRLDSLSGLEGIDSLVRFADTPESAVEAVEDALAMPPQMAACDREHRQRFAAENSWVDRAARVLDCVREHLETEAS